MTGETVKRLFICRPRGILQALGLMHTDGRYWKGHRIVKTSFTTALCQTCDLLLIISVVARDMGKKFERERSRGPARPKK